MLSTDDRLAIHELLALHGHVMDDGAFDRLEELFSACRPALAVGGQGGPAGPGWRTKTQRSQETKP